MKEKKYDLYFENSVKVKSLNDDYFKCYQEIEKALFKKQKNTLKTNEDGLVHYCLSKKRVPEYDNGIIIDRNKDDFSLKRDAAFRSGSYLAKTFSKDGLDKHAWRYGYSRLSRG